MKLTVELIPDPNEGGFTAHVPDIPTYGEGETESQAIADLEEALSTYIECYGLDDALSRVNSRIGLRAVDWDFQVIERAEDQLDVEAAREALAEGGKPVPLEEVERRLGIVQPRRPSHD